MMLAMKITAAAAATLTAAAGSGVTIAHLAREVRTLQAQVRVLDRSALAYGLRFGSGRQLVCIRIQAPSFSKNVGVLPAYKCVPSGS